MPPDCKVFLTIWGGTLGLQSSIWPSGAVVDRRPWWIGASITASSLSLAQSLGFARSRSPCFAIRSSSPSQPRWRLPLAQAAAPILLVNAGEPNRRSVQRMIAKSNIRPANLTRHAHARSSETCGSQAPADMSRHDSWTRICATRIVLRSEADVAAASKARFQDHQHIDAVARRIGPVTLTEASHGFGGKGASL